MINYLVSVPLITSFFQGDVYGDPEQGDPRLHASSSRQDDSQH
jgi:hypothetical protein